MRKLILVAGAYWLTFAILGANQDMPAFGLYGMAVHFGAILFAALVIAIDAANDEMVVQHKADLDAERQKTAEAESRLVAMRESLEDIIYHADDDQ